MQATLLKNFEFRYLNEQGSSCLVEIPKGTEVTLVDNAETTYNLVEGDFCTNVEKSQAGILFEVIE